MTQWIVSVSGRPHLTHQIVLMTPRMGLKRMETSSYWAAAPSRKHSMESSRSGPFFEWSMILP